MSLTLQNTAFTLGAIRHQGRAQADRADAFQALSTGRRVYRAAEDAAGLAVSENLSAKSQSQGAAMRNVNDGLSMIQTAEGGVREMSSMVKRMRELAVQAASETMADTERAYAQQEFSQLADEIGRIQKTTEFNGIKLLDGTWKGAVQVGTKDSADHRITLSAMRNYEVHTRTSGPWEGTEPAQVVWGRLQAEANLPNGSPPGSNDHSHFSMTFTVDGDTFDIGQELGYTGSYKAISNADSLAAEINTVMQDKGYDIEAFTAVSRFESTQAKPKTSLRFRVGEGLSFDMMVNHGHLTSNDDDKVGWSRETSDNFSWWNGATDNYTQSFSSVGPGGARIDTIDGALDAIGQMDRTLDRYNKDMSILGASHRRLQSAARRLETDRATTDGASSRIVDADFAYQSAKLARAQILDNAATAVLAQTNDQSQVLLRLI